MGWDSGRWPIDDADLLLVERFARGDGSAFDAIVARYQEQLAGLAFRLLGWRHDVDDVMQEVFLSAFRALPRFRAEANLKTWLTRITINKCRSHQRRRKLRTLVFGLDERPDALQAADVASSPADASLVDAERSVRIRQAIDKLRPKDRELIVLRYLEQMSIEELSELFGLDAQVIHVRLHRGRERLKTYLRSLE